MELSELVITREQNSRPFHLKCSINRSNRTIVHPLEQTPFGDAIQGHTGETIFPKPYWGNYPRYKNLIKKSEWVLQVQFPIKTKQKKITDWIQ